MSGSSISGAGVAGSSILLKDSAFESAKSSLQAKQSTLASECATMQSSMDALLAVWNGQAKGAFSTASAYANEDLMKRMEAVQQLNANAQMANATFQEGDAKLGERMTIGGAK